MVKRMPGRSNNKELLENFSFWYETSTKRDGYVKARNEFESSNIGIYENKLRKSVQSATGAEQEIYEKLLSVMSKLREETVALVMEYLQEENEIPSQASIEQIDDLMKHGYFSVLKLKKMCEMEIYKNFHNSARPTEYEKLFIDLMDRVDIRFALYAPKRSLSRKIIKFNKLPYELRDIMFARLEEFGLTDNEEFLLAHEKAFKEQIEAKGYVI